MYYFRSKTTSNCQIIISRSCQRIYESISFRMYGLFIYLVNMYTCSTYSTTYIYFCSSWSCTYRSSCIRYKIFSSYSQPCLVGIYSSGINFYIISSGNCISRKSNKSYCIGIRTVIRIGFVYSSRCSTTSSVRYIYGISCGQIFTSHKR